MPTQEPSAKKISGSAIACGGKKSYKNFIPKVFIQTFGRPMVQVPRDDFEDFEGIK